MFLLFLLMTMQLKNGLAQDCLRPADSEQRQIPFSTGRGRAPLSNGTQAIITTYRFSCCGRITAWESSVWSRMSTINFYVITFQVWRPSPALNSDSCYSLVGENRFMRTSGGGRSRVSVMPQPSNTINVQPGDVVGYDVAGFAGIQFDNSFRDETVWYNEAPLPTTQGLACPYPVASQSDWILTSSTNAGPLLSVHLVTSDCQPLHPTLSVPSSTPSPTASILMATDHQQLHPTLSVPSSTPSSNAFLLTGSTSFVPSSNDNKNLVIIILDLPMAILLLIIIATVIRISCYLLKKRKNTRIENAGDYADHHEYIEDSIEVKPNQVYGLNNAQYIEDSIEVKPNPVYVAYMEESTVTVTVEYETVSPTNSVTLHENNQEYVEDSIEMKPNLVYAVNHAEFIEDSIEVDPNQAYAVNHAEYIGDSIKVDPNQAYGLSVADIEEGTDTVEYKATFTTNSATFHENTYEPVLPLSQDSSADSHQPNAELEYSYPKWKSP